MIDVAIHDLIGSLDPADLTELRDHIRAIVVARERREEADLLHWDIHWETFSSLELVGVLAMIQLWIEHGGVVSPAEPLATGQVQ